MEIRFFPIGVPGPMEAVEEFLAKNNNFIIDESKHKFSYHLIQKVFKEDKVKR